MQRKNTDPEAYMTVGEIANKMGVTVRTLQYYHREGLLSPSAKSEGGRRLYTHKDLLQLHQILSLKHLGFSLDQIKNHLNHLDTPAQVAEALSQQAAAMEGELERLTCALKEIYLLRAEVLQIQQVDFKKYADIIVNLQMKNDAYWLIKYFDEPTLDHIRGRFDTASGLSMINTFQSLQEKAICLQEEGEVPEGEKGQALAAEFWNMILEFTGGDMTMLPKLMEIGNFEGMDPSLQKKLHLAIAFLEPALSAYFDALGTDPFQEVNS